MVHQITIEKNIPTQAGLAGGSADGAAVLVGLNKLFSAYLKESELCEICSNSKRDELSIFLWIKV